MQKNIGFIGLGLMGLPMAKRILNAGFSLYVYNRTAQKADELVSLGAHSCVSPQELASKVDILITMVTDGKAVEEVLFAHNGAVGGAGETLTVIDMSTIGRKAAMHIGEKLAKEHIAFLDAPVTGGAMRAATGELTIFVGGEESILEQAHEVLAAMGSHIMYIGPTGSGQAVKLINNFLIAATNEAMIEGLLLADGMKLSRKKLAEALEVTPNISPSMQRNLSDYIPETFPVTFTLKNLNKDLHLAYQEMESAKEALPMLTYVEQLFEQANTDEALSNGNFTGILTYIRQISKK